MTPNQLRILDFVRHTIENLTLAPTLNEIVTETGLSKTNVHSSLTVLVRDGHLVRKGARTRGLSLPAVANLIDVPTDRLRGELARRGLTFDALAVPTPLRFEGRRCAATCCAETVPMGRLMCKRHWYGLPRDLRDGILQAHFAKDAGRYETLVRDAIDQADSFGGVSFDRNVA